jgi:uncharacterized protein (DUF488 family)
MAKFNHEIIRCTEEKGNRNAATIFGVDDSNVRLWQTVGVRCQEGKSLDPRKDDFLKLMLSSHFFRERRKTGLFVNYDLLHEEAIKARSLNISQSCFKASKGWAIGFMHPMGLALWRRTIY